MASNAKRVSTDAQALAANVRHVRAAVANAGTDNPFRIRDAAAEALRKTESQLEAGDMARAAQAMRPLYERIEALRTETNPILETGEPLPPPDYETNTYVINLIPRDENAEYHGTRSWDRLVFTGSPDGLISCARDHGTSYSGGGGTRTTDPGAGTAHTPDSAMTWLTSMVAHFLSPEWAPDQELASV